MSAKGPTAKSLFELDREDFLSSITGITNGVEGLRSMLSAWEAEEEVVRQREEHSEQRHEEEEEDGREASEGEEQARAVSVPAQETDGGEDRTFTCRTCEATFASSEEQREHFKLDWHRCNVKRKVQKKSPLTEAQFDQMLEAAEVSSISGSDSEEGEESPQGGSSLLRSSSSFLEFQRREGGFLSICKTLLLRDPRENVTVEEVMGRIPSLFEKGGKWALFMCSGGHFAGACFEKNKVVAHKTIHRYTVRRKQGGSQAAQDSTGKKAKSAGASIRRYNEMMLQKEIRDLLAAWGPHLRASQFVFVQAHGLNRRTFFEYEETPFQKADPRLRKIPFTTRRPTFKELKRLHSLLSSVNFSEESMFQKDLEDTLKHEEERQRREKKKDKDKDKAKEERGSLPASSKPAEPAPLSKAEEELFKAASKGKLSLLQTVLQAHPDVNLDVIDKRGWTPLHTAANSGKADVVAALLAAGADPTILINGVRSKPPFNLSKTKEVRNEFRKLMAREPDKWDYQQAMIPSPLTEEMEKAEKAKEARRELQKQKELEKIQQEEPPEAEAEEEEEERPRTSRKGGSKKSGTAPQGGPRRLGGGAPPGAGDGRKLGLAGPPAAKPGSLEVERERRARAAEMRLAQMALSNSAPSPGTACAFCHKSLQGQVPFERLQYKYCATQCVRDHRAALGE